LPIFDDLEEEDDDDNNDNNEDDDNNNDDTETPDPVQAQIPSHPGIKYPVRGIPPSDIYIYIYIYRRFGGASPACPTPRNREIDFDFDSFVLRAGEAKLHGCVRDMPPQRWASGWGEFLRLRGVFFEVFAAIRAGSKWFCINCFALWCLFADRHAGFKCFPTGMRV